MKHTYEDLVKAGAPELPANYHYRIDKGEQYGVTIVDDRYLFNFSKPYGFSFIQGELNLENVVGACRNAHVDFLARVNTKRREDEWLGTY